MNAKMKKSLRRLAKNHGLALKLVRDLYREVWFSNFERSLFCSVDGSFYIAWVPETYDDERIHQLGICDIGLEIGPEYADSDHGWESFDDIDDEVWESRIAHVQCIADEIAAGGL